MTTPQIRFCTVTYLPRSSLISSFSRRLKVFTGAIQNRDFERGFVQISDLRSVARTHQGLAPSTKAVEREVRLPVPLEHAHQCIGIAADRHDVIVVGQAPVIGNT